MDLSDVHKNSKLIIDGIPYNVDEVEFMKPGKGRAIYRLKLRNLTDFSTIDRTYHSGDSVEEAHITTTELQYLYNEGLHHVFMDTSTFEQLLIDEKLVGNNKYFLKDSMIVTAMFLNDKVIGVTLPNFVELKIVETEVSDKKFTRDAQFKPAKLETGYTIEVPTFIKEGDTIKIDTRTGKYVERVNA